MPEKAVSSNNYERQIIPSSRERNERNQLNQTQIVDVKMLNESRPNMAEFFKSLHNQN
jgi:hypothetical protein